MVAIMPLKALKLTFTVTCFIKIVPYQDCYAKLIPPLQNEHHQANKSIEQQFPSIDHYTEDISKGLQLYKVTVFYLMDIYQLRIWCATNKTPVLQADSFDGGLVWWILEQALGA